MNDLQFETPFELENAALDDGFNPPLHLRYIEKAILQTLAEPSGRLIINMPPRHGKSELASVWLPAWFLLSYPEKRVILASYGSNLSNLFGRRVRDIVKEIAPRFYGMKLDAGNKSMSEFSLEGHSGYIKAVGVEGPVTGRGADLIIVDDPIKNGADANSPRMRENLYEWFRSTLLTRLEPGGAIVIVMTRWHEDDLSGNLIRDDSNKLWKQISIPAIASEGCPLGRRTGEALWHERYDIDALEEIRTSIGSYWFESQYNQNPQKAEGGIFKKEYFHYYRRNDDELIFDDKSGSRNTVRNAQLRNYITCDLAVKTSAESDYTVMAVFSADTHGNIFVRDVVRTKCSTLQHIELLKELYSLWKPDLIGIESVQYQYSLVETALAEGLPVKALAAKENKLMRFIPAAAKAEAAKLFFPFGASWLEPVQNEILAFPNSPHDDVVDCFSYMTEIVPVTLSSIMPYGRRSRAAGSLFY